MENCIKIGILDEHKFVHNFVEMLCKSYKSQFELVSCSMSYAEFYDRTINGEIDILIFDIHLPLDKGLACCKSLRHKFPDMKILVFSSFIDLKVITKIFMTGIHCYLPKTSSQDDLVKALKELAKSGFYYLYDLSVIFSKNDTRSAYIPIFSKKELQIIELVRIELTAKEISLKLGIHIKTVEMHKRNILDKTNSKKMIGAIDFLISNRVISSNDIN